MVKDAGNVMVFGGACAPQKIPGTMRRRALRALGRSVGNEQTSSGTHPRCPLHPAHTHPPPRPTPNRAGCKNYIGDTKQCNDNLILYPGMDGRSSGNRRCQTDDNGEFANSYHLGNTCTSADGDFYSFSGCTSTNLATSVYVTANNTLLSDAGSPPFVQDCSAKLSFAQWQALGQDAGSSVGTTPDVPTLIAAAKAKLGV